MRYIKNLMIILLFCIVGMLIVSNYINPSFTDGKNKIESFIPFENIFKKEAVSIDHVQDIDDYGNLIQLMTKSTDDVVAQYGTPLRIDKSAYDYEWWIYEEDEGYFQIGVQDEKVVTIYAIADDPLLRPFEIGASYHDLHENNNFEKEITHESTWKKYVFQLNDEDLVTKPLIQLTNDIYVVCYFDQFTKELSSVRFATTDVLLKQRLYDMEYRGTLPKQIELSREEWKQVESGVEEQIFTITNIYRKRHGISTLENDKAVAEVAYGHSLDMAERNYFSHDSLEGKTVGDRLKDANIPYRVSAENIAYNLSDGPDVSEGWLNSEAHRQAVLEPSFTILGVGVYEKHYTQNFIFN